MIYLRNYQGVVTEVTEQEWFFNYDNHARSYKEFVECFDMKTPKYKMFFNEHDLRTQRGKYLLKKEDDEIE